MRKPWATIGAAVCALALVASFGMRGWFDKPAGRSSSHLDHVGTASESPSSRGKAAQLGKPFPFHCGLLDRKSPSKFAVPLQNDSAKPLAIQGSSVSCGCVTVLDVPETIGPGQVGTLWFGFDPSRSQGYVRQQIVLSTDSKDAAHSIFQITISASIKSVWAEPAMLALGRVNVSKPSQGDMIVSALGFERCKVKSFSCDHPNIAMSLGKHVEVPVHNADQVGTPGETRINQHFTLSVKPDAPLGRLAGTINVTVETESGTVETRSFLEAEVVGRVECVPPQLVWAKATPGEKFTGEVVLKAPGQQIIDLSKVDLSPDPGFTAVMVRSTQREAVLRVEFVCPSDVTNRILRGKISGSLHGQPLFEIPVMMLVDRETSLESR